ncbi:MAG: SIR2 family protein [Clostridiales bacterium]|nr:SIR2 family protein [Clostridiales bacterium]
MADLTKDAKIDYIPTLDNMILPTVQALFALEGTASIQELDQKAMDIMGIPNVIREIKHGESETRGEVSYRLAWARTYLKKAGIIENPERGIWKFTKKFDGEIENINPEYIVKNVKLSITPTRIEAAKAFEQFVYKVLQQRAQEQQKRIQLNYRWGSLEIDAYLPDGIDELSGPVYVEIKLMRSQTGNSRLLKFYDALQERAENGILLCIFGTDLSEQTKNRMLYQAEGRLRMVIWDYSELLKRADPEADYAEYLLHPQKAVLNDIVDSALDRKESAAKTDKLRHDLKDAFKEEGIVLFLGAGVSMDAGIPLWDNMVQQLLLGLMSEKTREMNLTSADMEYLNSLASEYKEKTNITLMRYIRGAFDDEAYYKSKHSALYSRRENINTTLLNAIARLSMPSRKNRGVQGIVTYNFDNLVESKLMSREIDYNLVFRETDRSEKNELNIYHVHGYLPRQIEEVRREDINLVFSEEDYHQVYQDIYCWSNLVQLNFFRDNTCLFIGCSLEDPNVRRLLDIATRNVDAPRHYAILPRKAITTTQELSGRKQLLTEIYRKIDDGLREGLYNSLGLNILWIDNYTEIPEILNGLTK